MVVNIMNYKDPKNKEALRKFKTQTLSDLDATIIKGIDANSNNDYKRAALISYWLRDFNKYLNWESSFDSKQLKRYERGDVIKVNFGFNVGNEQGGLHYAIVIDAKNAVNNGNITVIPLSSRKKGKELHPNDVDLQDDLYAKLKIKCYDKSKHLKNELSDSINILDALNNMDSNNEELAPLLEKCEIKVQELKKEQIALNKIISELDHMKKGSIALVSQIRTVSKMRIFDSRTVHDVLSGIKISPHNLDLISEKMRELYFL